MKGVTLAIDPSLEVKTKEDLVKVFQQEVFEFSDWMRKLPDWKQQGALTVPEQTLLLTYLIQKYVGNLDSQSYGPPEIK